MLGIIERVVLPRTDLCTNPRLHTFHFSVYENLNVRHNIIYLKTEKQGG